MVRFGLIAALIVGLVVRDSSAPLASAPFDEIPLSRLQEGDLVLRRGVGWRADAVRLASRFGYSHAGLLKRGKGGQWLIVHAMPPEGDFRGGVVIEPLEHFAAADQAQSVAVWRSPGTSPHSVAKTTQVASRWAADHMPFDEAFNLQSDDAIYCTELVWKAYTLAGLPFSPRETSVGTFPFAGLYMLPSDLLKAGDFRPVYEPNRAN